MNAALILIACGSSLAVVAQGDVLTSGQTWTLVTILGVVLGACIKAVHWVCNRFVASLDKQHEKLTGAIEKNSDAVVSNTSEITKLVAELRAQSQQQAQFQARLDQDRKDAVAQLADAIEACPEATVDLLQRRKLA